MTSEPTSSLRKERAWPFALLITPVSILQSGLIQGALSLLLRRQGVSLERSASIVSLLILTQTIYFLWSPVTDFWMRRRSWLVVAGLGSAVALVAAFQLPQLGSTLAVGILFFSACLGQLVVAACGGMLGSLKQEGTRRRASGYYQASALAVGAGTIFIIAMLVGRIPTGAIGWILGTLIALPVVFALWAPPQEAVSREKFSHALVRIKQEFKSTFGRWGAIPYVLLMTLPMGSGAAIGLLPGVASDYHVSDHQIAWMNGLGGSLLTALGALAAGLIPARIRSSVAYLCVCLLNEITLLVLCLAPLTPITYFIGVTLYLFSIGTCYAMFTAVVLEFLGASGRSGSSRYSIINSLGNIPVAYMASVDGFGYAHWGTRGLAGIDAALGIGGACLLLSYFVFRSVQPTSIPAAESAS